jgi:MocE subfamily Rieske [2Fe-2S] domain protein
MNNEECVHGAAATMRPPEKLDYSLTGVNAQRAVELGLAEADWYQCPVPRATMRNLLVRRDGPAIRDTIIWLGLIIGCGAATVALWGTWWAVLPYLCYAVLYTSTSDSRWHESSHGTAFRTDWMNNALYELASFMVMRESTVWRWSHTRHHSDTIIVGRDPEIAVPRPPDIKALVLGALGLRGYPKYFSRLVMHGLGRMAEEEKTFIPESEFPKVFVIARIHLSIYLLVLAAAVAVWFATGSLLWAVLPLMLFLFPPLFGSWLAYLYGLTQHAGLAENVLDHRLNCRTVRMNFINRFLYWNMNYHIEHHMFPLVPYHRLPELHAAVKDDCPPPYTSLWNAWCEIAPALLRQVKDPAWHVKRQLPELKARAADNARRTDATPDADGWIEVCAAADLGIEDVIRLDHGRKTFALCRDDEGALYATDGICTHGNTHLADGLVKGKIVECPKHNGRFNLKDGSPARAPVCRGLATYPVEERSGRIWLNVVQAGGDGARASRTVTLRVVSSRNVSTFIRELVFEPAGPADAVDFEPGDYLQFDIPPYEKIRFRDFDIPQPYAAVWERRHVFDHEVGNPEAGRRNNYSIAGRDGTADRIVINVRIATPPPGQDCPPGAGSSYMFHLKPGDTVTAIGPFGDFHIKPTGREMVYIGGGAGMAPLRAHLTRLLEMENSPRRIGYWYGARSKQELYYGDYFERLAAEHGNFNFHLALSEPMEEDAWTGPTGFIHEVVREQYLASHPDPGAIEFYLCGPPMMIKACTKMLEKLGVDAQRIAYDEF